MAGTVIGCIRTGWEFPGGCYMTDDEYFRLFLFDA